MLNRLAVLLALVLGVVCLVIPELQQQQLDIFQTQQDGADIESSVRVQRQTIPLAKKLELLQALWQLIFGTARDTRRAFANITDTLQMNLIPDLLDEMPLPPPPTTAAAPNASTMEPPYRLTRQEFLGLLRKNLYGLTRLFNREYRTAVNDSRVNAAKANKDLLLALRPYFT